MDKQSKDTERNHPKTELPTDPHERIERIKALIEAKGGHHTPITPPGTTQVTFFGIPTEQPTEPGQPVVLYVANDDDETRKTGHWTDEQDPPEVFRTVTGPVNFNRARQVWVARDEVWRHCIDHEGRFPSTKGMTTEATPWKIKHVAVVGETEQLPDHILHPPNRKTHKRRGQS